MASKTYTWTLTAKQERGNLFVHWSSDAPFRAQQGQIRVYNGSSFPSNPESDTKVWRWDNEGNPWDTGQIWGSDWYIAWIAQRSPNGPYVYNVQLITTGKSDPRSAESK